MKRILLTLGLSGLLSGCADVQVDSGSFKVPRTINDRLKMSYARIVDTINEGLFNHPNLESLVIASGDDRLMMITLRRDQIKEIRFISGENRFYSHGLSGSVYRMERPEYALVMPKGITTARPLLDRFSIGTAEYYVQLYEEGLRSFCDEKIVWHVTPYIHVR